MWTNSCMINLKRNWPRFQIIHDLPCKNNFVHGKLDCWALVYDVFCFHNCEPLKAVRARFLYTKLKSLKSWSCTVPLDKCEVKCDGIEIWVRLKEKFFTSKCSYQNLAYSISHPAISHLNSIDKIIRINCYN